MSKLTNDEREKSYSSFEEILFFLPTVQSIPKNTHLVCHKKE